MLVNRKMAGSFFNFSRCWLTTLFGILNRPSQHWITIRGWDNSCQRCGTALCGILSRSRETVRKQDCEGNVVVFEACSGKLNVP